MGSNSVEVEKYAEWHSSEKWGDEIKIVDKNGNKK